MLPSLLFALTFLSLGAVHDVNAASFAQVQVPPPPFAPMWSPRTGAGMMIANTVQYQTVTCWNEYTRQKSTLGGYGLMVLWGGSSQVDGQTVPLNDVWVSDRTGKNWCFAAGVTDEGIIHPTDRYTFVPLAQAAVAQVQLQGTLYIAGGLSLGLATNSVWSSNNWYKWTSPTSSAPWSPRYQATMVADTNGYLTIAGGISQDQPASTLNDCWVSLTSGSTWYILNAASPGRTNAAMVAVSSAKTMFMLGGTDPIKGIYLNDVWALPEQTKSFTQITNRAQFSVRSGHAAVAPSLSSSTNMFVLGGANRSRPLNDVWLSSDYKVWKLCVPVAEWSARTTFMSAIDKDGTIWVMGGVNGRGTLLNDMWTSTWNSAKPLCANTTSADE